MAVQLYIEEENETLTHDVDDLEEWHNLIEEIGAQGQRSLVEDDKGPNPFTPMNGEMERVFETICPATSDVEDYSRSTIPIRVLGVIKMAQDEGYFDHIKVWYNEDEKDPIVVGISGSKYSGYKFVLARWGDELRDYSELKQLAMEQKVKEMKAEYESAKGVASTLIQQLDTLAQKWVSNDLDFQEGEINVSW